MKIPETAAVSSASFTAHSQREQQMAASQKVYRLLHQLPQQAATLSSDDVIVEEPLLIILHWYDQQAGLSKQRDLSVTMRTPGQDVLLTLGFLYAQSLIVGLTDIEDISFVDERQVLTNQIEVKLAAGIVPNWSQLERYGVSHSSCGICGASSLKILALQQDQNIDDSSGWLSRKTIIGLPDLLQARQELFAVTGAVHGAGYFSMNQMQSVHEDVGRHNALDKVIGEVLFKQLWRQQSVLVLSGRISFELVQKAVIANIPVIVAVGAPSSLAISAAKQFNLTLIGFTRAGRFNVYHGDWRLCDEQSRNRLVSGDSDE